MKKKFEESSFSETKFEEISTKNSIKIDNYEFNLEITEFPS